jgi:hypothetical protein
MLERIRVIAYEVRQSIPNLTRNKQIRKSNLQSRVGPVSGGYEGGELPRRVRRCPCGAQVTARAAGHRQPVISRAPVVEGHLRVQARSGHDLDSDPTRWHPQATGGVGRPRDRPVDSGSARDLGAAADSAASAPSSPACAPLPTALTPARILPAGFFLFCYSEKERLDSCNEVMICSSRI